MEQKREGEGREGGERRGQSWEGEEDGNQHQQPSPLLLLLLQQPWVAEEVWVTVEAREVKVCKVMALS